MTSGDGLPTGLLRRFWFSVVDCADPTVRRACHYLGMAATLQITIDCTDPGILVPFWVEAIGYVVEPTPSGLPTWNEHWRSIGVPEHEIPADRDAADSIVDPAGVGPRIWFQQVPEAKSVKNRLHLDIKVSGGREVPLDLRRERVFAEAQRLVGLGARQLRVLEADGLDHVAVVLQDPAGNEFCVG